MKNLLFALAFVLCSCLNVFSQATSLTVDCQNPGWLASYIGPENLSSIRNLTVTGQINGTDLATIGNLVKNYSLQGHLDLGDVTISENILTVEMFGVTNCKLEYLALPKSIGKMEKCIEWVEIDTLVCGNVSQPDFRMGYSPVDGNYTDYCSNIYTFNVKHLFLREGIESIKIFCQKPGSSEILKNNILESIHFSNGIKHLLYFNYLQNLSYMNVPEGVETLGLRLHTNIHIQSDTLFVPSSVKTFYDTWAGYDYRNAYIDSNTRNPNGRIKCLYLPENLETLWVDALINGTQVDIHIKAKNPPKTENGLFNSNTVVYVPVGYKEIYKNTGYLYGGSGYTQWGGATILEEVYAEQISINSPDKLYVGDSQKLDMEFTPYNTTFKDVTWEVSDSETLSLTQDGTCTALNYGTVQVTAINADRSCTDTKTIKVYDHTTGVNISKSSLKLKIKEKGTLVANTLPLETSDGMITWSTNDELVATVDDNGSVKGVGNGTCTITATSVDGGYTATCEITVIQPVEALTLEKHSISMKVGETEKLYAQISPTTADDKTMTWSSSDEQVASVDASGNVNALKAGETWVKAVSNDYAEAKDSCKVTVIQPVTGIQLDNMTYQLNGIGESFELKAAVVPDDASNKNVKWKSSDESVCVVSQGLVVAVGYGTCVIIATTEDGGYMATCTVTVNDMTGISTVSLDNGKRFQVYDAKGSKRTLLQKGVNIIQFVDGTKKKVIIR